MKILPILLLGSLLTTVASADNLSLPKQEAPIRYNSNATFSAYTLCGDFVATEEADNKTSNGNSKEDVQNHIQQLNTLMSPYFVRNQKGQIYPPALTYLIFGTSDICNKNPSIKLIDSIHQVAYNLAKIVEKANNETKSDIKTNRH